MRPPSVREAIREENQSYGEHNQFPLHCPRPGAVEAQRRRVPNHPGLRVGGTLFPGVQTYTWERVFVPAGLILGQTSQDWSRRVWSYIHWPGENISQQKNPIRPSLPSTERPSAIQHSQYHQKIERSQAFLESLGRGPGSHSQL